MSPLVVGLSKFWTPIGRDERWSEGEDDCGKCCADTLGVAEALETPSCRVEGEVVLGRGGKSLFPKGGRRFARSSCKELEGGRDVAGPCDI